MILLIHFKFKQTSKSEEKSSYDGFTDKNLLIIGIDIISMVYFYVLLWFLYGLYSLKPFFLVL